MHVVSPKRLRMFWERHPQAEPSLRRWLRAATQSKWRTLMDVRLHFPQADPVTVSSGRTVIVFNVAGNKYRLIAALHYERQKLYVLRVLTHREYDRNRWKQEL